METKTNTVDDKHDANGLWTTCSESIRTQVSDAVWNTTFSGARAVAFDEGELVLVVPNGLQQDVPPIVAPGKLAHLPRLDRAEGGVEPLGLGVFGLVRWHTLE